LEEKTKQIKLPLQNLLKSAIDSTPVQYSIFLNRGKIFKPDDRLHLHTEYSSDARSLITRRSLMATDHFLKLEL